MKVVKMEQKHIYFLRTGRIGFSKWGQEDIGLATELWGNAEVTRLICASGKFSEDDIKERLNREILIDVNPFMSMHLNPLPLLVEDRASSFFVPQQSVTRKLYWM